MERENLHFEIQLVNSAEKFSQIHEILEKRLPEEGSAIVYTATRAHAEQAAEYLRAVIGQNDKDIEWVAVRPSGLIDEEHTSEIEIYPSPTRSILDDGVISRINVGHFMAELITNYDLWQQWKGQMPVIYNKGTAFR